MKMKKKKELKNESKKKEVSVIDQKLPEMLQDIVEEHIGEAKRISLSYTPPSIEEKTEQVTVSVFNTSNNHKSAITHFPIGSYESMVSQLSKRFSVVPRDGVCVVNLPNYLTNQEYSRVEVIVVFPGRVEPNIDIYISHANEENVKHSISRISAFLHFLVEDDPWCEIVKKPELLKKLGGLEGMIKDWFEENGVDQI
jgi:hypothetical protein